ncbi:MAG TPA: TIGR03086 family metal-binding protein [Nocardioidaceae bacterium]|nr:TIGR03086 family metal-binding protein [Nocardioidaceae bacterium]
MNAASPWRGVELLERAIGYTRGSLTQVTPDRMSAPTPCAGWDLRSLLAHMEDSLVSLHEAGSVRRVRVDVPAAASTDLVEALRWRACELLADWSADWSTTGTGRGKDVLVDDRPISPSVLTSAGALEIAVHGWDVGVACEAARPLPDGLAADLLRVAPVLVRREDRGTRFGPAISPPPGATPGERLLAFLGRAA